MPHVLVTDRAAHTNLKPRRWNLFIPFLMFSCVPKRMSDDLLTCTYDLFDLWIWPSDQQQYFLWPTYLWIDHSVWLSVVCWGCCLMTSWPTHLTYLTSTYDLLTNRYWFWPPLPWDRPPFRLWRSAACWGWCPLSGRPRADWSSCNSQIIKENQTRKNKSYKVCILNSQ